MPDLGVLLTVPLESFAVRAIVATAACTILVRLLLRSGLQAPAVRVATALAPAAAVALVLAVSWGSLDLPALMLPVDGSDALPIPVRDGYLHFAPMALPLLLSIWALIVGVRLWRRAAQLRATRTRVRSALRDGAAPVGLDAVVRRLSAALRLSPPPVAVLPSCPGGALVIGIRRPVVIVGQDLLDRLDDAELEGVLAHELAHVKRRDNLVATALGVVRDLTFFVPGGGWALRHLHRERELAADLVATRTTGRPGALASGLLKVLEAGPAANPCAALAPRGTLVDRVRVLVDEPKPVSNLRRGSEALVVGSVVVTAVTVSVVLPATLAGPAHERDTLAVMGYLAGTSAAASSDLVEAEARAFQVYRRTQASQTSVTAPHPGYHDDERSVDNRRSTYRACTEAEVCPASDRRIGLGLRPRPTITVDESLTQRWGTATPVAGADAGEGLGIYWLPRADRPRAE